MSVRHASQTKCQECFICLTFFKWTEIKWLVRRCLVTFYKRFATFFDANISLKLNVCTIYTLCCCFKFFVLFYFYILFRITYSVLSFKIIEFNLKMKRTGKFKDARIKHFTSTNTKYIQWLTKTTRPIHFQKRHLKQLHWLDVNKAPTICDYHIIFDTCVVFVSLSMCLCVDNNALK